MCQPNPCKNNGQCFGYSGGYQCDCPNGYRGKNCDRKSYQELIYSSYSFNTGFTHILNFKIMTLKLPRSSSKFEKVVYYQALKLIS